MVVLDVILKIKRHRKIRKREGLDLVVKEKKTKKDLVQEKRKEYQSLDLPK